MKKILNFSLSSLTVFMSVYSAVFAEEQGIGNPESSLKFEFLSPIHAKSVAEVLTKFFNTLVELGAVAVVLAVVYAGFLFVAAKGNPEQLVQAKRTLYWTIIGSLILLGAKVIAEVIKNTIAKL